jgi:hypothetical protein
MPKKEIDGQRWIDLNRQHRVDRGTTTNRDAILFVRAMPPRGARIRINDRNGERPLIPKR